MPRQQSQHQKKVKLVREMTENFWVIQWQGLHQRVNVGPSLHYGNARTSAAKVEQLPLVLR